MVVVVDGGCGDNYNSCDGNDHDNGDNRFEILQDVIN